MNRIKLSDIKWLLVLLCLPFVSSCKDDLEAYEEAEITSVGAYHRYYTTEKDALTGEFKVAEKELEKSNSINEDEAVVGTGLQSVISSFVGARELFAVGDPDAFHAPAAAKDAPLDRDAARGPCAGAPQRQQNCQ